MEPSLRRSLAPAEISTLTAAMAAALQNVYVTGALLGLVVLFLGSRLPASLSPVRGAADPPRPPR
jgi:hypothetical protein